MARRTFFPPRARTSNNWGLPAELRSRFGQATLVMRLDIGSQTKLSRVDSADVVRGLERDGYFLQLPPRIPVEEEIARHID